MYSKRCVKLLSIACRITHFFGTSNLLMDKENEILYTTLWGRIKSYICLMAMLQYVFIFIPYQLINTWIKGNFVEFNFIMVMWLCAMLGCVFLAQFILQDEEMCLFMNMFLVFIKNFGTHYVPDHDPNFSQLNKLIDNSHLLSMISFYTMGVLFSTIYFILPDSAIHLTSEISDPRFKYPIITISYGLSVAWMSMSICALFTLSTFPLLIYIHLVIPIQAKEFRVSARPIRGQKAIQILRTAEHLPSMYRCMEYLTNMQNHVLSPGLIPIQTVILYLVLFCNTILIQHWNRLNITLRIAFVVVTVTAVCMWSVTLRTLGMLHVWNKKTLVSWKKYDWGKRKDTVYMKKFAKSCRPLSVEYKKYYLVRPKSVLKFLRGVSRGTFRALLLSLKKK